LPLASRFQRNLEHPRRQVAPVRQQDAFEDLVRRLHLLRHLRHARHPHQRGRQILQSGLYFSITSIGHPKHINRIGIGRYFE
jgi:hypothetical protein